jgi:hypothetical protein
MVGGKPGPRWPWNLSIAPDLAPGAATAVGGCRSRPTTGARCAPGEIRMKRLTAKPTEDKCPGMHWHWIFQAKAAGAARPQNPSRTLREMQRQGADTQGRQLRRPLLYSAGGSFVISKSFMSAATRNCPAFLMASIRFDPGGNLLAFSSASDALASQSCRSILPCVCVILFSLLRRTQLTGKPTAHAGFHRVAGDDHCVNVTAFLAFEGSPVEAGWSRLDL